MSGNIDEAIKLLKTGGYTFTAFNGNTEITSAQRGVKPLIELYEAGQSLTGFSAADKVIGKAAAFLYVLLKPDEIYTCIISKPALKVLKDHQINIKFDILSEAIRNRDNTGFCPMETAVSNTDDPKEALQLIYKKLKTLNQK